MSVFPIYVLKVRSLESSCGRQLALSRGGGAPNVCLLPPQDLPVGHSIWCEAKAGERRERLIRSLVLAIIVASALSGRSRFWSRPRVRTWRWSDIRTRRSARMSGRRTSISLQRRTVTECRRIAEVGEGSLGQPEQRLGLAGASTARDP